MDAVAASLFCVIVGAAIATAVVRRRIAGPIMLVTQAEFDIWKSELSHCRWISEESRAADRSTATFAA